ncbi:MAG: YIP1 family protein [Acidobacteria bacterium]|nr:YIP1 family protein [Acidobacteriota bacterium]
MSETENQTFPAPPPQPQPAAAGEGPVMSTPETLSGIFFEPGRTFESLRVRPRFLVAALLSVVAFMAFYWLYMARVGYENIINAEIEVAAQKNEMSEGDKARGRNVQMMTFVKALRYGAPLISLAIFFAAGAALYLLGGLAMGKKISYKQALSVWTYSGLPPLLLMMLANLLLLFIKPPTGDGEIARGLNGLVRANLGVLTDPETAPLLTTALASFDIFSFYGLFLAALGLRKVARMSTGMAWTVVLVPWLLGVLLRLLISVFTKSAVG